MSDPIHQTYFCYLIFMIGCYILDCIGLYYQWSLSIFKMATSTERAVLKRKRSAYDASFKLRVVQLAELYKKSAVAHEFCIDDRLPLGGVPDS